jgi:glycosylphosphatidylinositol deacylase
MAGQAMGDLRRPVAWLLPVLGIAMLTLLHKAFTDDQRVSGTWGCEMSWMTPSYSRVDWPVSPSSKYTLYLYREQGWDDAVEVS